jgi:hypothetical protein
MSSSSRRHSAASRVALSSNPDDVPSFRILLGHTRTRSNSQPVVQRQTSSRSTLPIRPSSVLGYTRQFTSRPLSPAPNPTPLTSPPDRPFTHAERRALLLADPVRYPPVLHRSNGCSVYASTQIGCILSPCGKCRAAAWDLVRFHLFGDEEAKPKPTRASLVVSTAPSIPARPVSMLQRVRTWRRSRDVTTTTTLQMSEKLSPPSSESTSHASCRGHRRSQSLIETLRGTSPLDARMPKALVASIARLEHCDATAVPAAAHDDKERPSVESLNSYHTADADVSK